MTRPAQAIIDLDALRHNYGLAAELSAPGQAMAIIKADAYGHGAATVARCLESVAPAFGVACLGEALVIREAGIRRPILLLEGAFTADEIALAARHNCWLMVANHQQIADLSRARLAGMADQGVHVWLKVDTGMHRLGFAPEECPEVHKALRASPWVHEDIVLTTHLACADEQDHPLTHNQLASFSALARQLGGPVSLANSPALLACPEARGDWNRPGFMLYGNSPFPKTHPVADRLQPVMTLTSAVIGIHTLKAGEGVGYGADWIAPRPSTIATVAMGYGDGYPRTARANTPVLVDGRRCPLVGRVSMDMLTVDITGRDDVTIGTPVELWGKHLSVNEVAHNAGTIGYELLTRVTARVPRVYRGVV